MSTAEMISDLPPKIHELITSFLDYFPLITLYQTNKYFRNLITREHIKNATLDLERRATGEGRPLNSFKEHVLYGQFTMISTHRPCYKCIRGLLTERYVLPSHTTGNFALNGSSAHKRKCAACNYKLRATWLTDSELVFTEGETWIDRVKCKNTKRFVGKTGAADWSRLAWSRGRCCFNCYWVECGIDSGEVKLVPYKLNEQKRMFLEVPIEREELRSMLKDLKIEKPEGKRIDCCCGQSTGSSL